MFSDNPVFFDNPALNNHWYVVAQSDDVTGRAAAVELLGKAYVLWRSPDGNIVAAPDRCPHREAPLSLGSTAKGVLTCAYHGWSFADGGRCMAVPSADPSTPVPPAAHLHCLHTEERYGLIWICPGTPSGPIPGVPYDTDPAFRRINTGVEVWEVSSTRMTDNFLDIAHFPWVHVDTFGGSQATRVPPIELGPLDDDFYGYAYEVDANNPEEAKITSTSDADTVHRWMSTGFHLPFTVRSTVRYETGLEHIILLISTPINDERSYFSFVIWRNDDFSVDAQEVISFDRAIGAEDKRMLEQVPGVLPLGRTDVVSVQSDKASLEWRRQFAELLGRS